MEDDGSAAVDRARMSGAAAATTAAAKGRLLIDAAEAGEEGSRGSEERHED